jgi:CHASE2 domain-containing sensor protein
MSLKSFKKVLILLALLLAILSISAISYFRLFDYYELGSLDLRFVLRTPKIPVTDKIVFIEIGQDTIDKLGRFPFDRNYHATIIKTLSESGARMILFDFLFSESQEHDKELEYALNQAGNAYLPYAFDIDKAKGGDELTGRGYVAECLEVLDKEAKGTGHINIMPDPDGKFRRIPPFIKYEDTNYPHIAFLIGCDYLGIPLKNIKFIPGKCIILNPHERIPLDEGSNMIVNFAGKWGSSYIHYSYVDLLQSYFAKQNGQKPILDLRSFKDKICIVGLTATGTGDVHPTPLEPMYPGMGIHAEIINSIVNNKFIMRASRAANLAVLLVLGFLISVAILKTKPIKGLFVLLSALLLFVLIALLAFDYFGLWIDMACPIGVMVLLYLSFTLRKYVIEWKNRLLFENELGIAKKIQESFLPKTEPEIEGVDISVSMLTARQVGGDLYDFVDLEPGRFGIMIGDVSGKGIPASLFMAMVAGSFKFFSKLKSGPKEVLTNLNSKLVAESSSDLFVTMFYAVFDMKEKDIVYSNGGHLPLLYVSREGKTKFFDSSAGLPLGLMDGEYSTEKIKFNEGGLFIFYTDGVTEAMNSKSELYGKERLEKIAKANVNLPSREVLKAIADDVRRFEPKTKQHDDITLIVVKV